MSDSDSDSNSSDNLEAENEGACGKLLEEIAEQDQVVEVLKIIFCPLTLLGRGVLNQPELFSNVHISLKKGSGGTKFCDFSEFIINFRKIKKSHQKKTVYFETLV